MINPVTLEVVRNALVAYANEMATVLVRTAYNMMIFEVHDYCTGIVDTEGNIISQNTGGLPIFLADLGAAVVGAMQIYGREGFEPGDVLVSNDPEVCGQHLNNIVVFTPFFFEGELLAFLALRAHWVDVGGGSSGFGSTNSQNIFDEGIQLRAIKIYKAGKANDEALRIIKDNIRYPDSSLGDLRAQLAGCRLGERRLQELLAKYGKATVLGCVQAIWDQAEALARAKIRQIPNGVYEAESYLDNDYVDRDRTVRIKVRVVIEDDEMTVDFSELADQVRGPINSGPSGGIAAARVAYKFLVAPEGGVTQGEFRPLKVVLPPGKLLSAVRPAPLGGWSLSLPTVIDTILLALAPALPELVPAGHKGDMSGYALMGQDRRRAKPYICLNIFGGGWGGQHDQDGVNAAVSICQGNVHNAPVEVQEAYYPIIVDKHEFAADSCGSGRHRGGMGIEIVIRSEDDAYLNTQFQRTVQPPWGILGGGEGMPNSAWIVDADGGRRSAAAVTRHLVRPGERVVMRTGGGGGYGSPLEREPERVAEDVRLGYISAKRARDDYKVVVDNAGTLDPGGTRALRQSARS
jgi:N-methylhydantoinase B